MRRMTAEERAARDREVEAILAKGKRRPITVRKAIEPLEGIPHFEELHRYAWGRGHGAVVKPALDLNFKLMSRIIRPKPNITPVELVEKFRRMDGQGSTPGLFRVGNQEASRGPIMAIVEPGVKRIVVQCSPQMFKTLLVETAIAYYTLVEPSSILVVEPTDALVKQLVQRKINPMIEHMQPLRDAVVKSTTYYKTFTASYCIFTNSGSDSNLGMNTIRIIITDEINKFFMTKSGPARILAEERASTFRHLARFINTCTPTTPDGDITKLFMESDQRRFYIDCPGCGHNHVPKFKVREGTAMERQCVRWDYDGTGRPVPKTARYHCPNPECEPLTGGHAFTEAERMVALSRGIYRQTRGFRCANPECDDRSPQLPMDTRQWNHEDWPYVGYAVCKTCRTRQVSNHSAGFHAWRVQSMRHDISELAEKAGQIIDDPMAWVNNMEAEAYQGAQVNRVEAEGFLKRIELYDHVISDRIVYATAGADVNLNKLSLHTVGWGRNGEVWLLDYREIEGDTETWHTWKIMDHQLRTPFQTLGGRAVMVEACSIDTGGLEGNADRVYDFCERFNVPGGILYMPIKGRSEDGRAPAQIYTPRAEKSTRKPYLYGSLKGKDASLRSLATTDVGTGFFHIGARLGDGTKAHHEIHRYLQMMTSEQRLEEKGALKWEKIKRHSPNEAWDTFGYARHAKIAYEAINGINFDALADRMGISRQIPDREKHFMTPEAIEATRAALARVDATGGKVLKAANSARKPMLPMVYRRGAGVQRNSLHRGRR